MKITFEQLPQAIELLQDTADEIKRLLQNFAPQPLTEAETLFTVEQTAKFLSLSVPTVYALISKGAIPCMKRSKRVYFSKADLIPYLKAGKKKTSVEINNEADAYLSNYKKK